MSIIAQDVFGSPFGPGDYVSVRFVVNSLSGKGSGSSLSLTTENPGGIVGFISTTLTASPNQVRRAQGSVNQPPPTSSSIGPIGAAGDQDLSSSYFAAGDVVAFRCLVNSVTGNGAGAVVNVSLEQSNTVGWQSATFNVSPQQTRRARELSGVTLVGA
jgi:hypothetical protein